MVEEINLEVPVIKLVKKRAVSTLQNVGLPWLFTANFCIHTFLKKKSIITEIKALKRQFSFFFFKISRQP